MGHAHGRLRADVRQATGEAIAAGEAVGQSARPRIRVAGNDLSGDAVVAGRAVENAHRPVQPAGAAPHRRGGRAAGGGRVGGQQRAAGQAVQALGRNPLGADVDQPADRAAAVEQRRRSAQDLDALRRERVCRDGVIRAQGGDVQGVQPVLGHPHPGAVLAADHRSSSRRAEGARVHARLLGQRATQGGVQVALERGRLEDGDGSGRAQFVGAQGLGTDLHRGQRSDRRLGGRGGLRGGDAGPEGGERPDQSCVRQGVIPDSPRRRKGLSVAQGSGQKDLLMQLYCIIGKPRA